MQKCVLLALLVQSCGLLLGQSYFGASGGGGLTGKVGLRAGATFEVQVRPHLWVQADLLYLRRYQQELFYEINPDEEYGRAAIDYLAIPVGIKGDLNLRHVVVYGLVAVQFSYGMQAQFISIADDEYVSEHFSLQELQLASWDVGVDLGAGIEKSIADRYKLFLEYRQYIGLVDLNRQRSNSLLNEGSVLLMGIRFRI
ncbi:MAG: outer membrane beta-barrel protein [Bacteroidota bacterium]